MATLTVEVEVPGMTSLDFTDDTLSANLSDGRQITVPLEWYPRLVHATPAERGNYELFGDGRYVHWPALDEDISIDGIIAGRKSGESQKSFNRWLKAKKEGRPLTLDALRDHDRAPPPSE